MNRIFAATLFVALLGIIPINAFAFAQSESRDDLIKQIETKRTELSALEKRFLAPSEEDRAVYAELLQQPHKGLIRLLPREAYDDVVLKQNLKSLTKRGGGAYYSFARLTHEYGYGSDIELNSGYLSVGFVGANFGMFEEADGFALRGNYPATSRREVPGSIQSTWRVVQSPLGTATVRRQGSHNRR